MFLNQCDLLNETINLQRVWERQSETLLEHHRMKKTAEEAAANGCRFPLAVWVQRGLKPGGCRQYSLDGRITLGSCMTTDFSSHNHAEATLAPQICHRNTSNVAHPIEKVCLVVCLSVFNSVRSEERLGGTERREGWEWEGAARGFRRGKSDHQLLATDPGRRLLDCNPAADVWWVSINLLPTSRRPWGWWIHTGRPCPAQ